MNRQGGFIQVAFELEAGLPDEVLILRIAIFNRMLAEVGEQADGLEVDVNDGVGSR